MFIALHLHFIYYYLTLEDNDDPFMVTDLGDVIDKYTQWQKKFYRVKPFYGTVASWVYLHQMPVTAFIVLCDTHIIVKDGTDNFNGIVLSQFFTALENR